MIKRIENINIKEIEYDIALCYEEDNQFIKELNEIFNN